MDITGHEKQADAMLAAIEKRFAARKGTKSTAKAGDTTSQVFNIPAQGDAKAQQTVYFIKDNLLVGIDDKAEAEAIIKRFAGNATDNLKSLKAYQVTMASASARPASWSRKRGGSSIRLALSLPIARCTSSRRNASRTSRKFCTTTGLTRSKGPADISINWSTVTSSSGADRGLRAGSRGQRKRSAAVDKLDADDADAERAGGRAAVVGAARFGQLYHAEHRS